MGSYCGCFTREILETGPHAPVKAYVLAGTAIMEHAEPEVVENIVEDDLGVYSPASSSGHFSV